MTEPDMDALQTVVARMEIQDTIIRAARGLDRLTQDVHDTEMLASAFTEDVVASYGGGEVTVQGRAELVRLQTLLTDYQTTSHMIIGTQVAFTSADEADADSQLLACLLKPQSGESLALLRGIRLHDTLIREPSGWRIRRRQHTVDWMTQSDQATLRPALSGLPGWLNRADPGDDA